MGSPELYLSSGVLGGLGELDQTYDFYYEAGLRDFRIEAAALPRMMASIARMAQEGDERLGSLGGLHGHLGAAEEYDSQGFLNRVKVAFLGFIMSDLADEHYTGTVHSLLGNVAADEVYYLAHEPHIYLSPETFENYHGIFADVHTPVWLTIENGIAPGSYYRMLELVDRYNDLGLETVTATLDIAHLLLDLGCTNVRDLGEVSHLWHAVMQRMANPRVSQVHWEFGTVPDGLDPFMLLDESAMLEDSVAVMDGFGFARVIENQQGLLGADWSSEIARLQMMMPGFVNAGFISEQQYIYS